MQGSIVSTASGPVLIAVRRARFVTCCTNAGMRTGRDKSVRTNTTPCPTGAGLNVSVDGTPVNNPWPVRLTSAATVFCGQVTLTGGDAPSSNKGNHRGIMRDLSPPFHDDG